MPLSVLPTKLFIPSYNPNLVARPRLLQKLDEGLRLNRKLTLICAPAGFGKTTLALEWINHLRTTVEQAIVDISWLSLDQEDNNLAAFLACLVAAIQKLCPQAGQPTLNGLDVVPLPSFEELISPLIGDLICVKGKVILVLDDYHVIQDLTIHEAMSFLLEHLPAQIHVVIATRQDPFLPLTRWRVRGQVTEIRQADLRFRDDEVEAFFHRMAGLELTDDEVTVLESRTEGWAAGLQLAGLALQGLISLESSANRKDFIASFSGSNRYVFDYLADEVLHQQSQAVQNFLIYTSILNRLCGSLCDAVVLGEEGNGEAAATFRTGTQAEALISVSFASPSQAILEYLEKSNLFIIPLDNERHWYRYHNLFTEFLIAHLAENEPGSITKLCRRAARWYESKGMLVESVRYALVGEDFDEAARLVEETAESLFRSAELPTLRQWFDTLPQDLILNRPRLYLIYAWVLIFTDFYRAPGLLQDTLAAQLQLNKLPTENPQVRREILAVQARLASLSWDPTTTINLSLEAMEGWAPDNSFIRSAALMGLCFGYYIKGDIPAARQALNQAVIELQESGFFILETHARILIGNLLQQQNQLYAALDQYQMIITQAGRTLQEKRLPIPNVGLAFISQANVLYQFNDLDNAIVHVNKGLEISKKWGDYGTQSLGFAWMARIKAAQGDYSGTHEAIQQAINLVNKPNMQANLRDQIMTMQVQCWLAEGNLPDALLWTKSWSWADLPKEDDSDRVMVLLQRYNLQYLTLAKTLITQHQTSEALIILNWIADHSRILGRSSNLLHSMVLKALLFHDQNQVELAIETMLKALALARPAGYIRLFVDEGESMARLLSASESYVDATLREYVEKLLSILVSPRPTPEKSRQPITQGGSVVESLSRREQEVLRLMAEGLSNEEIARKLYLSKNTLKAHTQNIYSKLDVHSRMQAVNKARDLGLLPPFVESSPR